MVIYNTLTRKKEQFTPITPGEYRIYVCGPTVYNFIHIGNARPLVVYDVLRRYLEYCGDKVVFVSNVTDIDDKLIKAAIEQGVSVADIAGRFEREFVTERDGLRCLAPTHMPRATEHIDDMIDMVQKLLDKGFAYNSGNDVYFRTKAFEQYGKLCHMPMEELESGARVAENEQKENATDFALWKGVKPGEPSYDAPFGVGRPGWHLECSAMALKYLDETFDLHGGGVDLVFPHHENEIAQSEAANGKPFARFFMHNGFINLGGNKMSKSLGNIFTVRDVAQKFGYAAIRFLLISAHYRSPLTYSEDVINQSIAALERIENCRRALTNATGEQGANDMSEAVKVARADFATAMDDDLNTADALAAIFEFIKKVNTATDMSAEGVKASLALLDELCGVLGIFFESEQFPQQALDLLEQRTAAKKARDFAAADAIRDKLTEMGYGVEDTRSGSSLVKL